MNRLIRNSLPPAIAWLLFTWIATVGAQSPAVVRLEPADQVLMPGETTTLTLVVEGAVDLFGVELHLSYDPAVVQVVDADANVEGVQLAPGDLLDPDDGFTVVNDADNETGELAYVMTLLAPAKAVSGDGIIATFDLRALADGTSPLALSVILASAGGVSLPVTVEDGQVSVGQGQESVPTPTPPILPSPTMGTTGLTPVAQPTPTGEPIEATPTEDRPGSATRSVATLATSPAQDSEATDPAPGAAAGPQPTSAAIAAQATPPAAGSTDQPGVQDQLPSPVAGETEGKPISQNATSETGTATRSGSGSASNDSAVKVGAVALLAFLLIAVVIFFGRRLLSR